VEGGTVCSNTMECRKQASSNREAQASFLSLSHLPCDGTLPAGVEGPGGQHVQVVRVRSCLETLPYILLRQVQGVPGQVSGMLGCTGSDPV
jgi:hypothetical protein